MSMGWMDSSACTLERGLRAEYDRIVGVGARIACGRHADQRQSRCSVEYVFPESASYKSLYCPFVLDRRSIRVQRVCAVAFGRYCLSPASVLERLSLPPLFVFCS